MVTNAFHNATRALLACAWLTMGSVGCSGLDDAAADLALRAGAGGATGSSQNVSGTGGYMSNAGQPANGSDKPGTQAPGNGATVTPPNPGAAGCTMKEDEKTVCVVCTDGKGNVVRDGCYTKDPKPAGDDCYDIKRMDGSLCMVCFDPKGIVTKSSCRAPDAMGCMPGQPPGPPIICKEFDEKGLRCTVCYDQAGKEVKRDCPRPTPPSDTSVCQKTTYSDGVVCESCTDASGRLITGGCTGPITAPPMDPGIKCGEIEENGRRCSVCWDATGKEIKRGCWDPAPTMPQMPVCKSYAGEKGEMCVICYDAKGAIEKQTCGTPPAGAPPEKR